eukprot:scaffold304_cov98-Cylindrotheca_fusiformis.AAC.2
MNEEDDGTRQRARIVEILDEHDASVQRHPERQKFRCLIGENEFEDILTYAEVMHHIEVHNSEDDGGEILWRYKRISGHEGPLDKNHPSWKGDRYNVRVDWENGEVTYEPLRNIAADDPVTCAIYAQDNNLLETDGWKRFKRIAQRSKKLLRMVNQSKLRSYKTSKKFMYGFEVPSKKLRRRRSSRQATRE